MSLYRRKKALRFFLSMKPDRHSSIASKAFEQLKVSELYISSFISSVTRFSAISLYKYYSKHKSKQSRTYFSKSLVSSIWISDPRLLL